MDLVVDYSFNTNDNILNISKDSQWNWWNQRPPTKIYPHGEGYYNGGGTPVIETKWGDVDPLKLSVKDWLGVAGKSFDDTAPYVCFSPCRCPHR